MLYLLIAILVIYLWWDHQKTATRVRDPAKDLTLASGVKLSGPATLLIQSQARYVVSLNDTILLIKDNSDPKLSKVMLEFKSGDRLHIKVMRHGAPRALRGHLEWLGAIWPFSQNNIKVGGSIMGRVAVADRLTTSGFELSNVLKSDWIWNEIPADTFELIFTAPLTLENVLDYDYEKGPN